MNSVDDTYIDRKNFIMNTIGKLYAKEIQAQQNQPTVNVVNNFIVDCKDPAGYCKKCLLQFFSEDQITGQNYIDNLPLIKEVRGGICSSFCTCNINNVDMSNTVSWSTEQSINTNMIDVKKIANEVVEQLTERYGKTNTSDRTNTNVTNIITSISSSQVQNINRLLTSNQTLYIVGTGSNVSNVSMTVVINAVMKAIATVCKDTGSCDIDQIISDQMQSLRVQAETKATIDTEEDNKKKMILASIVIGVLIFYIIAVALYRY